jgi:POT family proton-dependent oligopeptide transporter
MTTKAETFPPQIRYIIGNEACERFSFYGMRSILVVFMVNYLAMTAADAKATFHLFVSACYLLPLLGAFLSDRYLGKFWTIMSLSIVYCLGHGVLAVFEGSTTGLYAGLGLIALGSGGIKPCVSAFVGDQFTEKNKGLVAKVFDMFYFSINFGSFFSTLLIPWILPKFGPSVAFGIPGVLMAIATVIFWRGRKQYVNVPPTGKTGAVGFMPIFLYAVKNRNKKKSGQNMFDVAREKYAAADVDAAKAAWDVFKVFITVSAFWALYDQHSSSWILQAQKMDLNFMGMQLQASQIPALNPIMVMLLIPFFSFGVYPTVEKLTGYKMTPLRRMSIGMVMAALAFVIVGLFEAALDSGTKLSVGWQIVPYLVITMSEVMVSITGLEFAYTQAPRSMKSTIMSFWLLTVFVGNLFTAYIEKINVFEGATAFFFYAGLMAAVSLIFIIGASRYKVRDYVEKESNSGGEPSAASA